MQNKYGLSVTAFLVERLYALRTLQATLSQQMLVGAPSVAAHPAFLRETLRLQVQLPRCEALQRALACAAPGLAGSQGALRAAQASLDACIAGHLATIREHGHSLAANLARESLTLSVTFQQELGHFLDDSYSVPAPAPTALPD